MERGKSIGRSDVQEIYRLYNAQSNQILNEIYLCSAFNN